MRTTRHLPFILALTICLSAARAADNQTDHEVEGLIGELKGAEAFYFGYSPSFSNNEFLPLPRIEGGYPAGTYSSDDDYPHASSEVLDQIVRRGAAAVPALLRHLADEQTTRIPPIGVAPKDGALVSHRWIRFSDEYDFNRRTSIAPPKGVNQEQRFDMKGPQSHTLTVGDLCFVALGQIVNRNFTAAGGRPTAGTVINSPTHTSSLRDAARREFGTFTEKRHRELLLSDLLQPDHVYRRIGAYQRLSFYYPELLESNVVKCLSAPIYDEYDVYEFVENQLYAAQTPEEARSLFDNYTRANGKAFADGVLAHLGSGLATQEKVDRGELPATLGPKGDPRRLLVLLFGKPEAMRSKDALYVDSVSVREVWMFVDALQYDKNKRIDEAVYRVFVQSYQGTEDHQYINPRHPHLALACLDRLVKHGFDAPGLRSYLKDRTRAIKYETIELERMLNDVPGMRKQMDQLYGYNNWTFEVVRTNKTAPNQSIDSDKE